MNPGPLPFPAEDAPLWSAYYADRASIRTSFAIPGHKMRTDLVGDIVAGDRPIVLSDSAEGLTLRAVEMAERRAAALWQADVARFSVNGSSAANQAAVMAVAGPGDTVIVSRTLHKSVLFGLIHAGVIPVWVSPAVDPDTGFPTGMPAATVADALRRHPHASAALVGDPSYVGTLGDIAALADAVHVHGIPLVVDAAWAAHFGFHPDLPAHAIAAGADVMVTSAHKTLPAATQAALLLARGERVDLERLDRVFDGTQTTSAGASILASIDAARAVLEHSGERLLGQVITAVRSARRRLAAVPGMQVLDGPGVDPLKLVLVLPRTGVDGRALAHDLRRHGIDVETINRDLLIPQITLADSPGDISVLTDLLLAAIRRLTDQPRLCEPTSLWQVQPEVVLTPREAFYSPTVTVAWAQAAGRIAGEMIAPYPPGIPVLAPGERITPAVVRTLEHARDSGVVLAYAADPTLATVRALDA